MSDDFEAGGENEIEYEKLSTCDPSNVNASCVKLGMSIAELVLNKHLWSKSVELFFFFLMANRFAREVPYSLAEIV